MQIEKTELERILSEYFDKKITVFDIERKETHFDIIAECSRCGKKESCNSEKC